MAAEDSQDVRSFRHRVDEMHSLNEELPGKLDAADAAERQQAAGTGEERQAGSTARNMGAAGTAEGPENLLYGESGFLSVNSRSSREETT